MTKWSFATILVLGLVGGVPLSGATSADQAQSFKGTGVEPPQTMLLQEGTAVGDIVLPKNTTIDAKKSLILGSGATTYGKFFAKVKTKSDSEMVAKFFRDNLPDKGWDLIAEVSDKDIQMTFQKPTRVAQIVIYRSRSNPKIQVTVSPRN